MEISKSVETNFTIIKVMGEVDAVSSLELDNQLKASLASGAKNLLIDCGQLDYISSAGLGVFMSYVKDLKQDGNKMILFGLSEPVFSTFEILGLHHIIKICTSKEEAKNYVNE
jgi:anti-sigma B factor antagonist